MKKLIVLLTAFFTACSVFAGIDWYDNFGKAQEESKKTGKPILMLFTGSDWCGFCIRMDKAAFSKPGFQEFIQSNFVMFKADFPRRTKLQPGIAAQNNDLAEQYGIRGFPTVLITNSEGAVLARTGFIRGNESAYKAEYEKILRRIGKQKD